MKKLLSRRPSAGAVIGFIALCVALGGGAYAATSKKVEYKTLSKDARLKVLGVASTNAQTGTTPCDPASASTFTKCTSVDVNGSTGFPRKYFVVANGNWHRIQLEQGFEHGICRRPGPFDNMEFRNHSVAGVIKLVSQRVVPHDNLYGNIEL